MRSLGGRALLRRRRCRLARLQPLDCGAHGDCSDGTCVCMDGYTGTSCETAPVCFPFRRRRKVGKPAARQALKADNTWVVSECPLAATHLRQGMEQLVDTASADASTNLPRTAAHPILLLAQAYGLQAVEGVS